MTLKHKALIFIGLLIITFIIYKLYTKPESRVVPNTYTLVFFDKTLSNNYGDIEINSHKNALQKTVDNLKEKGDRIKVFYIDAITESANNRTPDAIVDFSPTVTENSGYIDLKNAEREYENQMYEFKKKTKQDLIFHFESSGEKNHAHYTDAWGIINRLKIEAGSIKEGDKMEVLLFSDMEESMDTSKGRRDFTKEKVETIQNALDLAKEDIRHIKQKYAVESFPFANNIRVKIYFPTAKKGRAEMEAYWITIFEALNIKVELI